jgi:hypothetical protein
VLIGLAGTLAGAGLGILVSHNLQVLVDALERALHTQFLDARVYFMSELPAYVEAHRHPARLRGRLPALCARDRLSGVARGTHDARGGSAS